MQMQGKDLELRAEYDRDESRGRMTRCLSAIAWGVSGHDVPEAANRYRELVRVEGRTPCSEIARIWAPVDDRQRPELLLQAYARHGGSPQLAEEYAASFRGSPGSGAGLDLLRREIARAPTSALALAYSLALVRRLAAAPDPRPSVVEAARIGRRFAADTRPYVQWNLLALERETHRPASEYRRRFPGWSTQMRAIARSHRAVGFEFEPALRQGTDGIDRGDLREALNALNEAVAIAERTGSPKFRSLAYLYRGRAFVAQGRQQEAVADLAKAAKAARLLGERYRLADTYHHMAHAYEARADWPAAIAAADSFVSAGAGVRNRAMRMIRLNDAAAIRWKAGFHARASQLYHEMVRTIDVDSGHYEYAGAYFERIGDFEQAARYYRKALAVGAEGSPKLALAGLTRVYEELDLLDSAIASARKHDAMLVTPERVILLPRLLARRGDVLAAQQLADRWVETQRLRGSPGAHAAALNQQAELLLDLDPSRARVIASSAENLAKQVNDLPELVSARRIRGLASGRVGDVDAGVHDLRAALSLSARTQSAVLPVTLKTDIANVLAGAGRSERALWWYAAANDALESVSGNLDDPVLLARFRSARRDIFDGAIRTALTLPASARAARILEWSERKKGSPPHALVSPTRLNGGDRAIIDYLTVGDTIVASFITPAGVTVQMLPISARATADLAATLLRPLREIRGGRIDIGRAAYSMEAATELYDGLLRPVERALGSARTLLIVPDVPLQAVPFDALVALRPTTSTRSAYSAAGFAADKWTISFAPTVSAALSPSTASLVNGTALLVSHVAPGSDLERGAIRGAWPAARLRELSGPRATEREVRSAIGSPIIHFATHSVSDDEDPLSSHLVLQPDGVDDGLLHASEIRRLRWGRPLVFLSACETAAGPMFSGTGTLSLARAFFDGGASMVIATQWPVGAISADISREFYRELANGVAATTALHRAKLAIRNNPATSHPFFWASHILISGPTRAPPTGSTR